ncbi:hypothetical protein CERZMDRAFT_50806 [Cercospora zeae-maydis SCOH1-5]|uniref:Uncharacterized protein n=1 Tax=Cercospora zeae-maydis SCOH1-5 TaxID=717836 RepID=A0A6A6F1H3_9PEZI|nr:hypothetical protein CERZMDRAFT_50806 [Cercospora zeae-maydis SCOH1-5]
MLDSLIETAFISSMVRWLHTRAGRDFLFTSSGSSYSLHGKPLNLLVNHGHTSNGAAGTAFVLIGLGGILALKLRHHTTSHPHTTRSSTTTLSRILYTSWLTLTFLSMLLSLGALIYTFTLTSSHSGQHIDTALAATLHNRPYPNQVPYPHDSWTPENWFHAVLDIPLASHSDRNAIKFHVRIMQAWRWNLIPMFVFGLAVFVCAMVDAMAQGRKERGARKSFMHQGKRLSV